MGGIVNVVTAALTNDVSVVVVPQSEEDPPPSSEALSSCCRRRRGRSPSSTSSACGSTRTALMMPVEVLQITSNCLCCPTTTPWIFEVRHVRTGETRHCRRSTSSTSGRPMDDADDAVGASFETSGASPSFFIINCRGIIGGGGGALEDDDVGCDGVIWDAIYG